MKITSVNEHNEILYYVITNYFAAHRETDTEIEQAQEVSDTYWTHHNQGCTVAVSWSIPVKMLLACHTDT